MPLILMLWRLEWADGWDSEAILAIQKGPGQPMLHGEILDGWVGGWCFQKSHIHYAICVLNDYFESKINIDQIKYKYFYTNALSKKK